MKLDVLEYIRNQKASFADAFPMVSFTEFDWGFHFDWSDSSYYSTNFILIKQNPTSDTEEIIKLMKNDKNKKIYLLDSINIDLGDYEEQYKVGIFYRQHKKIDYPTLMDTGVKSFSYRSVDKDFNLKENVIEMAEIEEIPENELAEFDRFVGGHLHLFNGELWSLDNDGSILSNALISWQDENEDTIIIDVLSTRSNVRRMGHGRALLQTIIASKKKKNFIILTKIGPESVGLLESLRFNKLYIFGVYF